MKSTKQTVRERVAAILTLRLQGGLLPDMRQLAESENWGVGERQLCRYLAEADQLLQEGVEKDRERLMAFHFSARRRVLRHALDAGDLTNARLVLADEAELLGLYPAKTTQVTGKGGTPMVLHIVEEVTGKQGVVAALGAIIEEVVTNDPAQQSRASNDPPASGTEGFPQI